MSTVCVCVMFPPSFVIPFLPNLFNKDCGQTIPQIGAHKNSEREELHTGARDI